MAWLSSPRYDRVKINLVPKQASDQIGLELTVTAAKGVTIMTLKPLVSAAGLAMLLSVFLPWVDVPVVGQVSLYEAAAPIVEQYRAYADLGLERIWEEVRGEIPWQGAVFAASFVTAILAILTASLGLGPRIWVLATGACVAANVANLVLAAPQLFEDFGLPRGLVSTDPADLWSLAPLGVQVYVAAGAVMLVLGLFAPRARPRRRYV